MRRHRQVDVNNTELLPLGRVVPDSTQRAQRAGEPPKADSDRIFGRREQKGEKKFEFYSSFPIYQQKTDKRIVLPSLHLSPGE